MLSVLTTRTIQKIKDSIDRPSISARLGSFEANCFRSLQAARCIDGAIKIMELLRSELTANDLKGFENLCESACSKPSRGCGDEMAAAKDLWDYSIGLDGVLSEERIRSANARKAVRNRFVHPLRPTNGIEPPKLAKPAHYPEKRNPFPPTVLVPGESQNPGPPPPAMHAPSGHATTPAPAHHHPGRATPPCAHPKQQPDITKHRWPRGPVARQATPPVLPSFTPDESLCF